MTESHESPRPDALPHGRTTESGGWTRLPYLVLFVLVYELVKWILILVTLVQFILRVTIGRPNGQLQRFGGGLGRYLNEVAAFLAYSSDAIPFPFGPWPPA